MIDAHLFLLFLLIDEDATFKQFFKFKDRVELRPYNIENFDIKTYSPEEVENLPVKYILSCVRRIGKSIY